MTDKERSPKEEAKREESILGKEFVDNILDRVKGNLVKDTSFSPLLVLQFESSRKVTAPLFICPESYEVRKDYFAVMGLSLSRMGGKIREAVLVSEGWYVAKEDNERIPNVRPSQHPKRKQAVIINGRNGKNTRRTNVIQVFDRDSRNRPIFHKRIVEAYSIPSDPKNIRSESLVDYLFPPRVAPRDAKTGMKG